MSDTPKREEKEKKPEKETPPKKRKTEPEVTIAPSGPGGPDISVG
jgi:hypothetical protein